MASRNIPLKYVRCLANAFVQSKLNKQFPKIQLDLWVAKAVSRMVTLTTVPPTPIIHLDLWVAKAKLQINHNIT